MTWTYSEEYYKEYTRETWNESADAYEVAARNLDKYSDRLLHHAAPSPRDRVLDVASGLGEPAFTLARGAGSVLGIDLSERMVEKANALATTRGAKNVEFRVMDAEKLDLPDASFELATCRFGLQIVTDPDRCVAETLRVLKPGGRFVATVWGPGERCPALHVIVEPMLKHAEPDETGYLPTPYEMGGPGELVSVLKKAGFASATEERYSRDWTFASEDEWYHAVLRGSPIGHSLREEDEAVQEDVMRETARNLQKWKRADGSLLMPCEAVVVSARTE